MADPNVQAQTPLTLSGGNDATNRYMNYYNQITTQLGGQHTPITPQVIELPREMQAQQITAPERIQAERLATEDRTYGDYANEVASYLNPYLQNAIRSRRDQTADYRAAADADAWSRGMGGSTYLSDQKNQLAKAEARDIMAAQNEFLANVGQQAFSALQNQYNRNLQANMQNAANALAADQFNANLANAVNQFNANALMQTDQYNIDNLLRVAIQNAQNDLNAQMANSEWEQYLQQLAWGWANQMYNTNPVVNTVYQDRGRSVELAPDFLESATKAVTNMGVAIADAFNPLNSLFGTGKKSTATTAPATNNNWTWNGHNETEVNRAKNIQGGR